MSLPRYRFSHDGPFRRMAVCLLASGFLYSCPLLAELPAPWAARDIGPTGEHQGAVEYDAGKGAFRINGAGGDIWEGKDAFHFVHQTLKGDGEIVAHFVEGLQFVDPSAEAGVMIRAGTEPDAPHALMAITSLHGAVFKRRTRAGGTTERTNVEGNYSSASAGSGAWLKLERAGSTFTASLSDDGKVWQPVGEVVIPMGAEALVGLAVTPHDPNQKFCFATLDDVRVTATVTGKKK